jgi:hypothetical protein
MKKFQYLGKSLSKTEQKKIFGGDPPVGGCEVGVAGRSCYTYGFPEAGRCWPVGDGCLCKQINGSLAGTSLDCTNIA